MIHFVRSWAKERGDAAFQLGVGAVAAEDSLLRFKAGLWRLRYPFLALRVVLLERDYPGLVAALDPSCDPGDLGGFFPACRIG